MIQVEPTNAEQRAAWMKPEMQRLDAASAENLPGFLVDGILVTGS